MCGLVGVFSKRNKNAGQYAFELYSKQKTRGQRGFGYLAIKDGYIVEVGRAKTELGIRGELMGVKADAILFHHRLPTSTDNTVGTTHPILVSNELLVYDYYVAHNGVITNASELKREHNELGYIYTTEHSISESATYKDGTKEIITEGVTKFNDSESLAIEIARHLEGLSDEIGTTGSVAFWAAQVVKETGKINTIYLGKNHGRDLCEVSTGKWYSFSSETGADLEAMKLYTLDIHDFSMTEQELKIKDSAKPAPPAIPSTNTQYTCGYRQTYPAHYRDIRLAENRKYTYEQVRYSGFDFTEFERVWEGGDVLYVPHQYVNKEERVATKPLLPPSTGGLEEEHNYADIVRDVSAKEERERIKLRYPAKDIERLEELAVEYALAEDELENLDDLLEDGSIDQTEFDTQSNKIQADIQLATELMSALGLPQDLVDETISEACVIRDYNYK